MPASAGARAKRKNARAVPTPAEALDSYRRHLARSALAPATQRSYGRHAAAYLDWLAAQGGRPGALASPSERDWAVRDWRRHLGLGPARKVPRQRLAQAAPRALDAGQLRGLLRALEARGRPTDTAAVALMAYAGLRVGEVAALGVDDVAISARGGHVVVRSGKGGLHREVPLPAQARQALADWLAARPDSASPAPFPGASGEALGVRALHRAVSSAARQAGFDASPHVLRHTFVTALVRKGTDMALVADLAGHRRLETTRRYDA